MSHSQQSILVKYADSLIGTWLVRELMRLQGPSSSAAPAKIYATVYSSRSRRAHELFTLGAQVIEMTPTNKSMIEKIIKEVKGVVVIPPLENRPQWDKELEYAFECIQKANPNGPVVYLSSVYGRSSGKDILNRLFPTERDDLEGGKQILSNLEKVEKKFMEIGAQKKWSVLRTTFVQEFLLHYSRLIQETGMLMLPIEKSKCSYLSLSDVASCILKCISEPGSSPSSSSRIYTLTGPESLSGEELVHKMNENVEAQIEFEPIDVKFARRYLRYELGDPAIALVDYYIAMMHILKEGALDFTTDDVKKITGKEPVKISALFKNYRQLFRP